MTDLPPAPVPPGHAPAALPRTLAGPVPESGPESGSGSSLGPDGETAETTGGGLSGPALRRSVGAAIASITLTGYAVSMSFPYFSVSLERMGASNLAIGINAAAPAVAMLLGAPFLPPLLRRAGLPLLTGGAAALVALSLLPLPLMHSIWFWTALRFLFGLGAVTAFWASELWIAAAAPPARRGTLIGIYGVFLSLGFIAGPASLQLLPPGGAAPVLLAAAMAGLSLIPVILARRDAPRSLGGPAASPAEALAIFAANPTVLTAVAVFGAVESGAFALLPVWGLGVGLTESAAVALSVWIAAGNLALQAPIGWAADRLNRRGMILTAAIVTALCAPLMPVAAAAGGWALGLLCGTLGGVAVALYTVSLAEIGARYRGGDLSRVTAAFMFSYGIGALAAPPLMGALADAAPPHGMLWALGGAGAICAAVAAARARRSG